MNNSITLWIARDKDGKLTLWKNKPYLVDNNRFQGGALRGVLWQCLFPEITFENSPQKVELKLINNNG